MLKDKHKRQNAADALAEEGCPCHAVHAHAEARDKENIHADVGERGAGEEDKRGLGVAERRKNAGGYIVEENERQTEDVDVEIKLGVGKDVLRRVDKVQESVAEEPADRHQRGAQHAAEDEGRADRRLHILMLLGAEELRHNDRRADVAAKGKCNKDQRDLIAVADGGKRIIADEFACDKAVRNVVQLLKNNTAEKRQAEPAQNARRFTDG